MVVNLLCEGMGIRAAARLTGCNIETVLNILEMGGAKCMAFMEANVRDVQAERVQIDEMFGFVYSKPQNTPREETERGDMFTYLSIDADSKLIINSEVGKRTKETTMAFLNTLRRRVPGHFNLTSDCYAGYTGGRGPGSVASVFGDSINYATELKVWGKRIMSDLPSRYFNPMIVVGIKKKQRIGQPDLSRSTTCHIERTNLSVRTFTRRFTRCTIGYSKKLANLRHAVAMFVCHFNFCRKHSTHGKTPAMAAGLTNRVWSVADLLQWKT